ncbi:MAG: hypothetical protein JKY09_08505 [Crocinitomicaceae bacterium]|nr:hypothetical protein [Crocinitomicaceae bacterium]
MEKKTKYILVGLGVVAVGAGAYVYYLQQQKKKRNATSDFNEAITSNNIQLPAPTTSSSSGSSSSGFPLKKGSRGTLVTNLQNALIKKYGASILPKYGADGGFGSETHNALISKGLPTVITSEIFTQIVLGSGSGSSSSSTSSSSSNSSSDIASSLHSAITKNSISTAIRALKKIKNVSSYSAVNSIFKKTRTGLVRKTLVTALLDRFSSPSEKKQLNQEFYRIGLKYDGSKWSLSGVLGIVMDQLVTIEPTKIWDESGRSLQVPKATILGEYLDANNGATEFETLDRRRLFVKTTAISYVS